MCRLLAYLGKDTLLDNLIFKPDHSLERQAWQPQELREAKLNADGFGFAWYNNYDDDQSNDQSYDQSNHQSNKLAPCYYRQTLPIWNDANLNHLANSLSKPLWLAMVRSATPGLGVTLQNTQPFCFHQWSFLHNGYLLNFGGKIQHNLRDILHDKYLYLIKGNTDSEYIFALLMQLLETNSPLEAIRQCVEKIAVIIADSRALLNFMLSDGHNIYALRHAINGLSPSLYYTNSSVEFSVGNQLLVSEKLNKETCWQPIDEHKLLCLQTGQALQIVEL